MNTHLICKPNHPARAQVHVSVLGLKKKKKSPEYFTPKWSISLGSVCCSEWSKQALQSWWALCCAHSPENNGNSSCGEHGRTPRRQWETRWSEQPTQDWKDWKDEEEFPLWVAWQHPRSTWRERQPIVWNILLPACSTWIVSSKGFDSITGPRQIKLCTFYMCNETILRREETPLESVAAPEEIHGLNSC